MRVLAVETATPLVSVAVVDASGVLAESTLRAPMRHLEWLLPATDGLLRGLGLGPEQIEAVAVSRGPGGFTGLRIGIATACAWARARSVPVLGVGTLEAFAGVVACGLALPVLDAHRGEVAAALYRAASDGTVTCLVEPLVASPQTVGAEVAHALGADRLRAAAGQDAIAGRDAAVDRGEAEPVLVFGDGVARHGPALLGALGPRVRAGGPHLHPRAATVGLLARPRFLRGECDDPGSLLPIYGRRPAFRPWQETPEPSG